MREWHGRMPERQSGHSWSGGTAVATVLSLTFLEHYQMQLAKRQQWLLFAAAASAAAAPLAERALVAAWRGVTNEDPPDDPAGPHVDWGRAIVWTAGAAMIVAVAQVVARRGAALAWEHFTGEAPPRPKHRRKRKHA